MGPLRQQMIEAMSEFVEYLQEVFEEFGSVQARRMFGGHGLFHDGLMFGLVANDTLYLKADAMMASEFEARGLEQFEYARGDASVKLSYFMAPDDILDQPREAAVWAKRAYEAALRARKNPPKSKK